MRCVQGCNSSLKLSRNSYCTVCSLQFYIRDVTFKGSNYPLLLDCGHSVCESCIKKSMESVNAATCGQCGITSSSKSVDGSNDYFPFDLFLTGSLVVFQNHKHEKEKRLKTLAHGDRNFSYYIKEQPNFKHCSKILCCEECSLAAVWYCENCESNFCEVCWSKIHMSAKSLKKHIRYSIKSTEKKKNDLRKCANHDGQSLEFFCVGCEAAVCSYCIILEHQGEGHSPITLKEKNAELLEDIKSAADEAKMMSIRIKHTLEKINHILSSTEVADNQLYLDLENQVSRNFGRLHGILQLEEERILKKLYEKANERENRLSAFRAQLESHLENIGSLLNESEVFVRNSKALNYDVSELRKKLLEVKKLPCYLISQETDKSEIKIAFDDALIDSLRNFCTLDLPSNESFRLLTTEDLSDDYAVDSVVVCDDNRNEPDLENGKQDSSASVISDVEMLSTTSDKEKGMFDWSGKGVRFVEGRKYSVRLCYIKNPGEFYVTLNSQRVIQQRIDKMIRQFTSGFQVAPKTLLKGDVYLVMYNVDKNWYRARVTEILDGDSSDEKDALVYYLDYGNTESVPISRMRPIPEELLEEPPLAIKCQLFDCVPKNKSWCAESTKVMGKILENSTVTMFVKKVRTDCLEVDLSRISADGQIGKDVISVRDALIFLELSHLVGGKQKMPYSRSVRYMNQSFPPEGETFEGIVTHVNSPSDFYIQRERQDIPYVHKLFIDLQNYYSENYHKGVIYDPVRDVPCAALYPADQKWYRAKIVEIFREKMITVFYVDYGNTEKVPWTMIRKLNENFVKRPPLAFRCSLAGIRPHSTQWDLRATSYMETSVQEKNLRFVVDGRDSSESKLNVLLYRKTKEKEICVNTLFVDLCYAVPINPMSSCLATNILETSEQGEDEMGDERPFVDTRKASDNTLEIKKKKKRSKLNARELRDLHTSGKRSISEDFVADGQATPASQPEASDTSFKAKVEILSAESPSTIYVTFPALTETLKSLQSQMNEFYRKTTREERKEWEEGSKCAVYWSNGDSWCRGSVLSTLSDGQVKVFLIDNAVFFTASVSLLRELDPCFSAYPTCAVKCHLAHIAPPGNQWPSVSCECLLRELDNYSEVYMTKKGEIENKSLPVELWVERVLPTGALEPSSRKWITLNRHLVEQGLAVPLKTNALSSGVAADSRDHGEEEEDVKKDSDEAQTTEKQETGAFDVLASSLDSRWLPAEPLKNPFFVGIPTYVDLDAFIYIYDVQDEQKLMAIKERLLQEHEHSEPPLDSHFWVPEEMCIVQYHVDNCWYRGLVLKTNEDLTHEVLFVDYGNVETCQASELRKRIKMSEVPTLTRKFRLQGIIPITEDCRWPVSTIEILHSLVVDKKCEVKVFKSLDPREISTISLRIIEGDGIDVGSFLVEKGLARFDFVPQSPSDFDITENTTWHQKLPSGSVDHNE